jgi:uncharacterized protein YbjT (DUF2867 family)
VFITGANGNIGMQLLPALLQKGHSVTCLVRDKQRFIEKNNLSGKVQTVTGDLLKSETIEDIPTDIDVAYYVVNSQLRNGEFSQLAALAAHNFVQALDKTNCKQIVFLSRGSNIPGSLHARLYVMEILHSARAMLTVCLTVPDWHLIWPFHNNTIKKMLKPLDNQ